MDHDPGKVNFPPYEFDPGSGILTRSGTRLRLEGQPARVLELLLEARGRMVARGEIIRSLWPGETKGDFDRRLDKAVAKLRASLNDDPLHPRFVETIKGRGYRFIAKVSEAAALTVNETVRAIPAMGSSAGGGALDGWNEGAVPPAEPAAVSAIPEPGVARRQMARRWKIAAALACAALVAGFAFYVSSRAKGPGRELRARDLELSRITTSGDVVAADLSPDGKYVAYVRSISGQQSIWLRQLATGLVLQLTSLGIDSSLGIDFSPDGTYLYFVRLQRSAASGDLYRIPTMGGESTLVISGVSGAPSISPDGSRVAFVRSTLVTHGVDSIVTAKIDGSDVRVLAAYSAPGIHFNRVTWSADGQALVYPLQSTLMSVPSQGGAQHVVSSSGWQTIDDVWGLTPDEGVLAIGERPEAKRAQIYLVPAGGAAVRAITHDFLDYTLVRATRDGKTLLAVEKVQLDTIQSLIPGRAAEPTVLTVENQDRDGVLGLAVGADGRIVYASHSDEEWSLTLVDRDGGNPTQLTHTRGLSTPAFSPRGDSVVVAGWTLGDQSNLFLVDLSDGRETRLTEGKQDYSPSVTPDGRWIVYATIDADKSVLMKVPASGGSAIRMTDYNADHPTVSPDGKWIACLYVPEPNHRPVLAVLSIAGGPPKKTYELPAAASSSRLAWTPDGRAIAFIVEANDISNIWQQPVVGGPSVPVTHFRSGKIFDFQWSHLGRLVMARGSEATDAVLIRGFR